MSTTYYAQFEDRTPFDEDDKREFRVGEPGPWEWVRLVAYPVAEFRPIASVYGKTTVPVAHVALADGRLVPASSVPGFVRVTIGEGFSSTFSVKIGEPGPWGDPVELGNRLAR